MPKYHYHLEWFSVPDICTVEDKAMGVVRAYEEYGVSEYSGGATIVKRLNGLHEPLAWWVTEGSPVDLSIQGALFLIKQGLRLAWTFEIKKFKHYERLLRNIGELKVLKTFSKRYNGIIIRFHYGEIIPHGDKNKGDSS